MDDFDHPLSLFNTSGFKLPFQESEATFLLDKISEGQNVEFSFVELVYVSEKEIVRINKEFLKRDYITDIISFRYDDNKTNLEIEGTLYCCSSRILEQSIEFSQTPKSEFLRILIHGLLHLCGYDDQTEEEKAEMTQLENHFLSLL